MAPKRASSEENMESIDAIMAENEVVESTTIAHVATVAPIGFEGELITIECDTNNGLPGITIVGLGNKAIDEAKERIRSAINNSKLEMPRKKITLNLAPADLPKVGSSYDVPLALAILCVSRQIKKSALKDVVAVGELSLDGKLRPTKGSVAFAQAAKRHGFKKLILPRANADQAALVDGIEIIAIDNLRELYRYLNGAIKITPHASPVIRSTSNHKMDLADVHGQPMAKRAIEIAAAGGHNLLLTGPPGTGKTMLAKTLTSILPPLDRKEVVEVTKLHSLVGIAHKLVTTRPFRSPHHSASHVALIGGGRMALPGEVSLAHRGVLFLDEIPEFGRQALESLRQPLEDREVTIARAESKALYPADFMLIATSNPCPCGYLGDEKKACECTPNAIYSYKARLSGPLMDRIDMVVSVDRIEHREILSDNRGEESSREVAGRIRSARTFQSARQGDRLNSSLNNKQLAKLQMEEGVSEVIIKAAKKLDLSARSYLRLIRVARTVADLRGSKAVGRSDIAEALQYRIG